MPRLTNLTQEELERAHQQEIMSRNGQGYRRADGAESMLVWVKPGQEQKLALLRRGILKVPESPEAEIDTADVAYLLNREIKTIQNQRCKPDKIWKRLPCYERSDGSIYYIRREVDDFAKIIGGPSSKRSKRRR